MSDTFILQYIYTLNVKVQKVFKAVTDYEADFDFLGLTPPSSADFSAGLFFNPFIFRVCSLLRSCFCMWIRP